MRLAAALILSLAAALPAAAEIRYLGGAGDSRATAIVVDGALGEFDGVGAEYAWLRRHRPGWEPIAQALVTDGKRRFDILTITHSGKTAEIWFDITGFFGH